MDIDVMHTEGRHIVININDALKINTANIQCLKKLFLLHSTGDIVSTLCLSYLW